MAQKTSVQELLFITGSWTALVDAMVLVSTAICVKDVANAIWPIICQLLSQVVGEIVVMPTSARLVTLVRLEFIPAAAQSALVPRLIMGNLANTVVIPADLIKPAQAHGIQCLQRLRLFPKIYSLPKVHLLWKVWLSLRIVSSSWKILSLHAVGLNAHVLLLTMVNLANTAVTLAELLKLANRNGINGLQNLHSAVFP